MGSASLAGMLEATDMETALRWHLSANLYPPPPSIGFAFRLAMKAIAACQDEEPGTELDLPLGVLYRGSPTVKACEVVRSWRLEMFVEYVSEA